MVIVEFEALDGELVFATGPTLSGLIKGLSGEQMKDKRWTIRTMEISERKI